MATAWSAYEYQPSFVLGFHGCDKATGEKILRGTETGWATAFIFGKGTPAEPWSGQ
jgi:hypothetical protein